ncbi:MAG: EI24 domain-containing protein [Rhodospirillales bacterium]|nr:EI24 domain-containing protein [Rhodospirillales bacterium]
MISAFLKAVSQFSDPAIRRVMWISVGSTVAIFVSLFAAIWFALRETVLFDIWWIEDFVDMLGATAAFALTWILFPAVASLIVGLLLERVANAVEARHYPHLPAAPGPGIADALSSTLKLVAVMVALNVLALPLYLIPVINLFVFYSLNGYLLGREYFELAALRRMIPADAYVLRKRYGIRVFLSGALIAFLLTVPVVNLLAPVIGTAAMVHLVQRWRNGGMPAAGEEGGSAEGKDIQPATENEMTTT